jgi:molecular chaperone DnaJ
VLGVPTGASAGEIRVAYRGRARLFHPDRVAHPDGAASGERDDDAMARVNEAYRVLCDPGRRAAYDRSLATSAATDDAVTGWDDDEADDVVVDDPLPTSAVHSRLAPDGPARIPWKLMAVAAIVGSTVVLLAAAFTDPPADEPPDGILRTGSCVEIEPNGDAREIACSADGVGDVVVELLIPTGARCPAGTLAHRDRLGLGTVCIEG